MKYFFIGLIWLYQKTISPDHGILHFFYPYGYCKFSPSCSEYTKQALGRFGVARGIVLGFKRVFRCNPWSIGGEDPIPQYSK